jgi:hypothetical protein
MKALLDLEEREAVLAFLNTITKNGGLGPPR